MVFRRVVVTGIGSVAPESLHSQALFDRLLGGVSSIRSHPQFASSPDTPFFGGYLGEDAWRQLDERLTARGFGVSAMSHSAQLACDGALQAWEHANLSSTTVDPACADRVGLFVACWRKEYSAERLFHGVSAWDGRTQKINFSQLALSLSASQLNSRFEHRLANQPVNLIAQVLGLQGAHSTSIDACAAGGMAIANAFQAIRSGRLDAAIAGGAAAAFDFLPVSLFHLLGALAPLKDDEPASVSCPFSDRHRGFVMGENGGFVVLESLEHARLRGAHILAEVMGCGKTLEAYRPTASPEDGCESARCMQAALDDAGLPSASIDHINTHGTSTPSNDTMEINGIRRVFGDRATSIPLTATKSALGHSLAGSGGVEAVISVLSLVQQRVPPTLNFDRPCDAAVGFDVVRKARCVPMRYVLSNSFGFGGENTSIIFGKELLP